MGCIDAVLPEQLLRRPDVNCLVSNGYGETYKDYLYLFRAIAVHLYGSSELETNAANLFKLRDTNTTTWIGKHEPISVSISSNLIEEPVFLCDKDPKNLIVSFVEALEEFANKSKTEMQTKFASIQEIIESRVKAIFEKLNERKGRTNPAFDFEDECIEEEEEADMSTQFLQMQKNQLLDLQQHFELYINTLPVFGFNSGKYDLNLIKSYLLPYLIHERDIQPTVIKKANHFVSFKFGDVQFLDILNFLGGATSLDSFLTAYKTSETKGFFPYEWFDSPNKLDTPFLAPYECFFSKLKNHNPLEKEFTDYTKLLISGLSQQEALKRLRLKEVPPSGVDNYNYLKVIWEEEQMSTFRDFVKCVDGFCAHCDTVFETMGCYFNFWPCQEARASLSEEEMQRGIRKREHDELRRDYLRNKGYNIVEVWECKWWERVKEEENVRNHVRKNFPFKLPMKQESLLAKKRDGKMFGYVQCYLEVPDGLKYKFSNFPPIFKNFNVSRANIGENMREYAIENNLLKQPQRMLISSFKLENGTIITPLLNFYLSLGLKCTKIYRFVQYTPKKCFNNFVQSVVDARRAGDENTDSSVVAETMKLLGNSSYGYQIMDRSRHTETKYLNDEKTHKAINGKKFKRLNSVSKEIYEVEADASHNFFPRTCCSKHKKYDEREPGLFKEEFRCTEMICLCSKTYCCYDAKSDKYTFSSKGLNKRTLEETGDGPMEKYRRVMDEIINLTSINR
ncbi:uncharacterized protein LOC142354893, partial [Convolutriloba macropyga]|uniref:uncharacterized protein LOC142354893 n=1 Tax=Convolutriloba macropyga TaxID=536237 RepID=UPI003F521132